MRDLMNHGGRYWAYIGFHALMGVLLKVAPSMVGIYFLVFIVFAVFNVFMTADRDDRAAAYALYVIGFEILYRMSGFIVFYELGKYGAIMILLMGTIMGKRSFRAPVFILLLLLLIPAIFLTHSSDSERIREMVLFNLSGPLTLVFSGFYFYNKPMTKAAILGILRFAFLPAFAMIIGLSLRAGLDTLHFTSVQSNPEASGGFAANQVSTILGWFILIPVFFALQGVKLTPWRVLDYVMIVFLFLRGLLTFSRGGILSMLAALSLGFIYLYFRSYDFRLQIRRIGSYVLLGVGLLVITAFWANSLTNNYLLFRYQGKSTSEVLTGIERQDKSYLSGREYIMLGDLKAFIQYPILGTGYGMAMEFHKREFGHAAAAHTEYSRLLAEQGVLGLLFILLAYVYLPIYFFRQRRFTMQRTFFLVFFLVSFFTMFHAAMRLAMPGIVMGFSFFLMVPTSRSFVQPKNDKQR
ncbi:MAG: O-antigen ligase family protein [Marinilabiliaceae bacterium]|nr:O-antigen ligase family protein [Marinilabiliaceae bacterium]